MPNIEYLEDWIPRLFDESIVDESMMELEALKDLSKVLEKHNPDFDFENHTGNAEDYDLITKIKTDNKFYIARYNPWRNVYEFAERKKIEEYHSYIDMYLPSEVDLSSEQILKIFPEMSFLIDKLSDI